MVQNWNKGPKPQNDKENVMTYPLEEALPYTDYCRNVRRYL